MIWTVAKKELRGYFNSAVAAIYLAAFLAVTLYTFFFQEKFFARGIADLRPLFEWMPRLLIIIVSALAMRLWSDERRAGTLELLLTLPVPRWKLVLGKFLAGMLLIAIALALTLGLPLTISHLGHLDHGPVIGGYLAALLLSAAYLAIGMCVSASTDNQIVAFIGTALLCGVAYAIGNFGGDVGRLLGTGARFESVARGVLDLRDLAYYGAIVCIGVSLNVLLLQRLTWGTGAAAAPRRRSSVLGVVLVAANAVLLVVWLAPVHRARIDLTRDGTYSLSPATEKIVGTLDERMLIRGYFSAKTHPKLAPLIPQIKDLLEEYRIAGRGKIRVEFVDPTDSDDAKRDAKERFGIDPTPLQFATQTEQSVVNAYFAIAIEYGDQHAVIPLSELISVRAAGDDVEVTAGNLEYQITKTIKKTVAEFSSVDALFASTPGTIELTAYITPDTLPENFKDAPAKLQKVVDKLVKQSHGKLHFSQVAPKGDAEMQSLYQQYGLRPYQDLATGNVYYFGFLLKLGDRVVRISPPQELGEEQLASMLTDGLKRASPGFTRVVGLWVPQAGMAPPMQGMQPQQTPPPQQFETLRRSLAGNYEVRDVNLDQPVPDDVEALVLAGPANFDEQQAANVDQFVMRGHALVVLDGRARIAMGQGLELERVKTGLEKMFQTWGIDVGEDLVMDEKVDAFPLPQQRDLGNGMTIQEVAKLPYPFFISMDGDQLSASSPITSGLAGSVMHWAAPVKADVKVGDDKHQVVDLLKSSDASWTTTSIVAEPDLKTYPVSGFPGPGKDAKVGARVLAVAVTGGFGSSVPAPTKPAAGAKPAPATAARIEHSPPDARVVVFGSSAFVSDDLLNLAHQLGSTLAESNVELVHNAVDWALADTDLLSIRSHNAAASALTVPVGERAKWEVINIAIALVALVLVVLFAYVRRRSVKPILVAKEA